MELHAREVIAERKLETKAQLKLNLATSLNDSKNVFKIHY